MALSNRNNTLADIGNGRIMSLTQGAFFRSIYTPKILRVVESIITVIRNNSVALENVNVKVQLELV